jgi:hypothetical protein
MGRRIGFVGIIHGCWIHSLGKGEAMGRIFKRTTILFIVLAFVTVPCAMASSEMPGRYNQVSASAMAGDAILARPLGVVSLALGFGLFVISSPFSALGGNIGDAWMALVANPAKFTFARPLGEFERL